MAWNIDTNRCVLSATMTWRFADLPVRTKFMFTLGIPVLGMMLLIGKQVDSNIKRSAVYEYIKGQTERIGLFANVMHELQKESAYSGGFLIGRPVTPMKLKVQFVRTDVSIAALQDPTRKTTYSAEEFGAFTSLPILRERVLEKLTDISTVCRAYRTLDQTMLDELGRVQKLQLDPETKDRMYAHVGLLNAKEALSVVRDQLSIALNSPAVYAETMALLGEQVSVYETNMLLFERDAPPEVMATYKSVFQGADVNFMRSVIGTVKERRTLDRTNIASTEWWELSLRALDKLKEVEDHSLALIVQNTVANSRNARLRLIIVLIALFGVVGAVTVMGYVVLRGVSSTVNEVNQAARSLSLGEVGTDVPVNSADEIGQMAESFNSMIDNIRSLASSAESIGKGNYETSVLVRGPNDVLGNALTRMKENLKAARLRDNEQALALNQEKKKIEEANVRIQMLIKEMHHRVKNNFQVIASLLRMQAATLANEELQEAFAQSQSRITSMALIHEKLYQGDELATVDVGNYIHELFAELVRFNDVDESISYSTDLDKELAFDLTTMVPLGLLMNELISNSFKHAFKGSTEGLISLSIHHASERNYDMVYTDNGTGIPQEKLNASPETLGVSLINSLVEQLNGRMAVQGDEKGTT